MHLDDNERHALAKIEANLSDADPDFSSFLRRSQRFLPPRLPSWPAIGVSGVLLVAAAAVLVTALRLDAAPLFVAAGVLLALSAVPVTVNVRRSTREPTHRPRRRLLAMTAGVHPGRDEVDVRHAVVVATDAKPESDAALRFAAAEAAVRSAELLVVITYWRPIDPDLDDIETPESELRARAHRRADVALRRALSMPADQLPEHRIVSEHGDVSRRLLRDFGDAEMLVIGTHRRRGLLRIMHGHSIIGVLVRHAHTPVVVVPPTWT